jgi:hypothetical protein
MDLKTLQRLRIIVPGTMILFLVAPLLEERLTWSTLVETFTLADNLKRMFAAVVCGAIYYVTDLRSYALRDAYRQIRENVKRRLLEPCLGDPVVAAAADRLREGRILMDSVFYHFVDSNRTLTEKAKRVYFNGLIWSSTADVIALSTVWSAPQSSAHREELRVSAARYSAGLRIPSAEWGARVL